MTDPLAYWVHFKKISIATLLGTNTLAYVVHSNVMKKMKCCEILSLGLYLQHIFLLTYVLTQRAKVLHYTSIERLARVNHCGLLGSFLS